MKVLTDREIDAMKFSDGGHDLVHPSPRWHEGTELLGYWEQGDSFIFLVEQHRIAISRPFIKQAFDFDPDDKASSGKPKRKRS